MNQPYYRLANLRFNENRCAKYLATESDTGLTTTHELSGTSFVASISSTESSTRLSTETQQERERAIYAATESDAGVTTTYKVSDISDLSVTSLIESTRNVTTESDAGLTTRSSSVTQQEKESDRSIIYVAETFSALLLIALLGVLVLALLFASYVHYQRKKTSKLHGSYS